MKRLIAVVLLLLLCGCAASPSFDSKVTLYYPAAGDAAYGQLLAEYPFEGSGKTAEQVLSAYFSLRDDAVFTPFPANISICSLKLKEDHATLVLSDEFASINGIDLTMACVAITKTVSALTGATTVTIGCNTVQLDGEQSLTFSESSFVWADEGIASLPAESTTPTK